LIFQEGGSDFMTRELDRVVGQIERLAASDG